MRIDSIILNNFGSYEGETIFDTNAASGRNIILIGGKNGAGKTTLFTAMRVCLYGFMSMGYKNYNAYYVRSITKLINKTAKMSKPTSASVSMQITLTNRCDLDHYELVRFWKLSDTLVEQFSVKKNGVPLSSDEVADFEKYILSIIPPELFNLYFFDGEKIAEFFMDEGGSSRIKNAFLTLCGYDTFDIMRRNFKRLSSGSSSSSATLDAYWKAKQEVEQARFLYESCQKELSNCDDAVSTCDAEIAELETNYTQKGGISQDEWNEKMFQLRENEKKREVWNSMLKKWANEIIPFLMVRDSIVAVREQLKIESNNQKFQNFREILESPSILPLLGGKANEIKRIAFSQYGSDNNHLFDLSLEQSALLFSQMGEILSFDQEKISKCKRAIKRSISVSAKLRKELENSSTANFQDYMNQRVALYEKKSELLARRVELEQRLIAHKTSLQNGESSLSKYQAKLEEELKKASINDISTRSILMLDKLQRILYRQQISKVESTFRNEIKALMRKKHFIDDIKIDDNFNIFLFRHEPIPCSLLLGSLEQKSEELLIDAIGTEAVHELYRIVGCSSLDAVFDYCSSGEVKEIVLPIRVDQSALSNGEKQIFIMALYYSLVQLGRQKIPFIIDTPFARIDTEHRRNISTHFFSKLQGQVFILSTNEEINSDHVKILSERIATTYTLENTDNSRTVAVQNSYFEV